MTRASTMLEVRGLNVRYGGVQAVEALDLDVFEGETVVLVGANGAGKSSVLHSIIGVVRSSVGTVVHRGTDISDAGTAVRARRGIRLSPEGRRVFASLSVEDNVLAGTYGCEPARRRSNLSWLRGSFPLLTERRYQLAGTLSGGQQQIVALARALAAQPDVLLLDEPFLGLSPVAIQATSDAVRTVQRRGTAILLSEQMARPALRLADRGYVMRAGVVRRTGTAAELADSALTEDYL